MAATLFASQSSTPHMNHPPSTAISRFLEASKEKAPTTFRMAPSFRIAPRPRNGTIQPQLKPSSPPPSTLPPRSCHPLPAASPSPDTRSLSVTNSPTPNPASNPSTNQPRLSKQTRSLHSPPSSRSASYATPSSSPPTKRASGSSISM